MTAAVFELECYITPITIALLATLLVITRWTTYLELTRISYIASLCIDAERITGPPRGREVPNMDIYTYLAAVSITHYDTA
jgi:hypothetical protein